VKFSIFEYKNKIFFSRTNNLILILTPGARRRPLAVQFSEVLFQHARATPNVVTKYGRYT